MVRKAIFAAVSTIALFGMQTAAMAGPPWTVRPAGNTVFTGPITATVSGQTLNCTGTITLNASPNNSGDGHSGWAVALPTDNSHTDIPSGTLKVTGFTLSGGLCGLAVLNNLPYTVQILSSTGSPTTTVQLKITGISAGTFLGGVCSGDVTGTLTNSTSGSTNATLAIPSQTITGGCTFSGTTTSNHPFRIDG